jgi:endothelin-converting enzyme
LAQHEIPAGKGAYGAFDSVSEENKRIIKRILDTSADVSSTDEYDKESLTKLRDLYASCLDEDTQNKRGIQPLQDVVRVIRDLYRSDEWKKNKDVNPQFGLTAAISFMHSRGIDGLFDFDIDGDVGVDPDFMTLWFSQPELGLPSKVGRGKRMIH